MQLSEFLLHPDLLFLLFLKQPLLLLAFLYSCLVRSQLRLFSSITVCLQLSGIRLELGEVLLEVKELLLDLHLEVLLEEALHFFS